MFSSNEFLVRDRQRGFLAEADRQRLVAEARRAQDGSHVWRRVRTVAAQVPAVVRLRRRLA